MNIDEITPKPAIGENLAAQVAALQDRMDIMQLPILYCHFVRQRNAEALVQLFTSDGTFWLDGTMGPAGLFTGDHLRSMYANGLPDLDPWPLTHNIHVTLHSPIKATGLAHVEFRLGSQGYRVTHLGLYEDDFAKECGVWKFRHRKMTATPLA
jgi:hypothetical protein